MIGQYEYNFKETLKSVWLNNKNKKPPKTKWLYPASIEKKYYKLILEYVKTPLVNFVKENLFDILPKLIEQKKSLDRADSWIDDIENFIKKLQGRSEEITGQNKDEKDSAWKMLKLIGTAVFIFNGKQFKKSTRSVLGFDYITGEDWWDDLYRSWANENYNLIKGLSDEYIKKINTIVWDGFRGGLSNKTIATQIQDLNGEIFGPRYKIDPKTGKRKKLQSRAELIARDQVGKLNGDITKKRMQEIGADIYIWNTAMDERVRGRPGGRWEKSKISHWDMEGKLCKWSDNSVYADNPGDGKIEWKKRTDRMTKSIPGYEYQCRCTATTYWNILLNEIQ